MSNRNPTFAVAGSQATEQAARTPSPGPTAVAVQPVETTSPSQTESGATDETLAGKGSGRAITDRRASVDRRLLDMGSPTGLERRRGPGRRRDEGRRSAEEGEMTDEQFEFVLAVDTYKRLNNRPFPTWTEVLEVVKQLGYRKVSASTLTLSNAVSRASTQIQNPPAASGKPAAESDCLPG